MTLKQLLILPLFLVLTSQGFSQDSSDQMTMTHIKYRLEGPGLTEITRQTKELWRVGDYLMRSLEPADPERNIQPLLIYSPPDVWLINMYDSSGTHSIDKSNINLINAPIFSFRSERPFLHFQFGREMEYLTALMLEPTEKKVSDSLVLDVYEFEILDVAVTVNIDQETQKPHSVVAVDDTLTYKIIYESYETGLTPDNNLFLPPDTSKITEVGK